MSVSVEDEYEALIQFLYIAPIGLVQTRLDGEIVMVNPLSAQLLMPLSSDGQLENLFTALESIAPDLRARVESFSDVHGTICDAVQLPISIDRSGRTELQVLSLTLLKLDEERLMAVLADVTQSVQRDRELRQSQAWINSLANGLTDYALVALDHAGRVQGWNPSIGRLTGMTHDDTAGRSYQLFYPADALSDERVADRLHDADRTGWSLDEGWRMRADGSRYWGSCLIAPLHAPDEAVVEERAYSLIIRDVSDRREATEALRRAVSCDHLTGVANRRAFYDAAELEMARWNRSPRPLSAVMVDADHFKRINDVYGHAAGDAVLRHMAAGLAASFRTLDVVARIGGEEFVVLLPGASLERATQVAERYCRMVSEQSVEFDGVSITYTVSAGVAAMGPDVAGVHGLIRRADVALYAAKAGGRNRVVAWHDALVPADAA